MRHIWLLRMASRGPDITPADALFFQIDYGGPLRGPWPLRMQIHMQNESDDDNVPALVSDSESSEDEVWTDELLDLCSDFSAAA